MWTKRWTANGGIKYLSANEEEYIGLQREKKQWVRICALLVGFYLVYYGIASGTYYASVLGIVLALASLMFKDLAVTAKGAEIRYLLPGWHLESLWTWDEITHVLADNQKAKPNVALHIGKDTVHRVIVVKKSDAEAIKALAKKMNPSIRVTDMTN